MGDENSTPLLSHKSKSPLVFSVLFFAWAGATVLVGWIVQGGALYLKVAAKIPFLDVVRATLLSYFTRPYVF